MLGFFENVALILNNFNLRAQDNEYLAKKLVKI